MRALHAYSWGFNKPSGLMQGSGSQVFSILKLFVSVVMEVPTGHCVRVLRLPRSIDTASFVAWFGALRPRSSATALRTAQPAALQNLWSPSLLISLSPSLLLAFSLSADHSKPRSLCVGFPYLLSVRSPTAPAPRSLKSDSLHHRTSPNSCSPQLRSSTGSSRGGRGATSELRAESHGDLLGNGANSHAQACICEALHGETATLNLHTLN